MSKRKLSEDDSEKMFVAKLLLSLSDEVIHVGENEYMENCSVVSDLESFLKTFKKLIVPFTGRESNCFCFKSSLKDLPEVPFDSTGESQAEIQRSQSLRLILLRHTSKCIHPNGQCPVTPFCWGLKYLWLHILECKEQECKTKHCISSRCILSHYSICKVVVCPVCKAVRAAVKKNYERRITNQNV
jgi:hypothetical protein